MPLRLFALIALSLVLTGCASNTDLEGPWIAPEFTPQGFWLRPASDFARILQGLFTEIVILATVVFVIIESVLYYAMFKFRRRDEHLPAQTHGNTNLEIAWTIAPAVVLAIIAVPTVQAIFQSYHPQRTGTIQVTVIGHQWWWEYQYPELGITTANEIHFKVGQTATLALQSADVIHAYWVAQLGGKRDAIPTRTNELWWTPEKPGVFYGQCTQLCGTSHANMRLRAIVHDEAGWNKWVADMRAANGIPTTTASAQVQKGYQLVSTGACIGCHTIQGTPLQAKIGPNLTRFGERTTMGSGMYDNTAENVIRWLKNPQDAKPGNKMPNLALSDDDAAAIAAYLLSLK